MGHSRLSDGSSFPLGELIRRARQRRCLSRRELAELVRRTDRTLGTNEKAIERWELRGHVPQPPALRALASVLGLPLERLATAGSEQAHQRSASAAGTLGMEEADTRRRTFMALLATLPAVFEADRVAVALGAPWSVDQHVLDDLEAQGHEYGRMYWSRSPASFWPTAYGHLAIARHVHQAAPVRFARQAGVVGSRAASLLGMLAHRLHRRADAVMLLHLAAELADEAGDGPLRAHALVALRAVYSPVTTGQPRTDATHAVRLLDEADHAAGGGAAPLLRAWLHACRAEDHAILNQPGEVERDIEAAEHFLSQAPPEPGGFFHHWNPGRLAGFLGSCHVHLGQPERAVPVLETVARETDPALVGPYTAVLSDLAAAYAQRAEVERACSLLSHVLATAQQASAPERADRVRRIRQAHLARWVDAPPVRQLDAQLESLKPAGGGLDVLHR